MSNTGRTLFIIVLAIAITVACITGCRDKEEASVKMGAILPLTGEGASYGERAKRGIELAVEELNAAGGLLGKPVSIDFQDDRNDKKEAVSIMTKFATIDKVPVVFGSAGSSVSLAIAPLANRYKVVLISPISSSSQLSTEGGPYFFRTCPADDLQAEVLANWVINSGAKQVAIVYTNNSWGKPLAEGFQSKFEAPGGKVLSSDGVAEGSTDFRTIITKLKGLTGLDAVVSPTYPKEGAAFVRQARELGLNVPLFGGDNWGSPEFLTIAGEAAEGVFYTAPSDSKSPEYAAFAERYKAKYDEEPDVFGAYSYDAANAIFKAITAAGNTDAQRIRDALLNVSFVGASGDIAFRPNGDLKSEAFARKTIRNGQAVDIE
ncbi:MAG: ABC transporter substrate-binding protein [Sedimentisphaerales bacterium]|nr:ABC transporter substrate-binding protein [Sedimentisphaerales bacterium]